MPSQTRKTDSPASDDEYRPDDHERSSSASDELGDDVITTPLVLPKKKRNFRDSEIESIRHIDKPTIKDCRYHLADLKTRVETWKARNSNGYIKKEEMEAIQVSTNLRIDLFDSFLDEVEANYTLKAAAEQNAVVVSDKSSCSRSLDKQIVRLRSKMQDMRKTLNLQSQQIRNKDKMMFNLQVENDKLKQQFSAALPPHNETPAQTPTQANHSGDGKGNNDEDTSILSSSVNDKLSQHDRELRSLWKHIHELQNRKTPAKSGYVSAVPPAEIDEENIQSAQRKLQNHV